MTQQSGSSSNFNTTSSTSQSVQESVGSAVQEVKGQAKEKVGQVTDQARQQVNTRLSGQKDRAAEGLTSVASALRQTGQQLRDQDQAGFTDYIDSAAAQVERVSTYLRDKNVGELVDDVERLARRQPALFVGGAFVLGLLGARFLKSSRPQTSTYGQYPLASRQDYSYTGGTYGQGHERELGGTSGYGTSGMTPATTGGSTYATDYGTDIGTTTTGTTGTTDTSSYGTGTAGTTGTSSYGTGTAGTTGTGTSRRRDTEEL